MSKELRTKKWTMKKNMFNGAGSGIFENARQLRNNQTDAEVALWIFLRKKPLGYKFRRQHPWGEYIADFYCHRLRLVIEIDGSIHNRADVKEYDTARQEQMELEGLHVMRLTNDEMVKNRDFTFKKIESLILQRQWVMGDSSPLGAGGEKLGG